MTGRLLLGIAVILLVAEATGHVFSRLGQPPVIGHIIGGILLGPTVLGLMPGNPTADLFPTTVVGQLRSIGQLGLSVFMFNVGWDLDLARVRQHARTAGVISGLSITLPFALGLALATALYPGHRGTDASVGYWAFALFIAASLSITAFPVLARILTETHLADTHHGVTALAAAAVDDVVGWTTLAVILAFTASDGMWAYASVFVETAVFVVVMVRIVGPGVRHVLRRPAVLARGPTGAMPMILAGVLASSYVTDAVGVHAVFGAFLFGAVMPRWHGVPALTELRHALCPIVAFLVPIYFVVSGLAVDLAALRPTDLAYLGLIIVIAVLGKFGGAFAAARLEGFRWRDAATVGVLMNARGLIEIVILTIGLDRGIIDQRVFSLLVVTALVTTLVAPPALRWLQRDTAVRASDERASTRRRTRMATVGVLPLPSRPCSPQPPESTQGRGPSLRRRLREAGRPDGQATFRRPSAG